jgi:signal transduction histidine kinase
MYLMAFIVLAFWLARRQDKIYGLFSMMLFFWATHNLNLVVPEIPVSARLWESLTMSTLGWTVLTMIFFIHCFAAESHPKIERLALVAGLLGVILFFLPDIAAVLHVGYRIWDALLIVVGVYLIYFLTRFFLKQPELDNLLMLLVGIPMLICGLHDILLVNHFIDRTEGLIIHYSVFPALMLFSWLMLRRFVQSINQAEHLAAHLEQRVKQKTSEIQMQYEKLKEMESQSLLAGERERIMRDMHDGIGGQLVSVITLLQEQPGELFKRKQGVDDQGLWIPDDLIGDFFDFLFQYNFTVEENELYD